MSSFHSGCRVAALPASFQPGCPATALPVGRIPHYSPLFGTGSSCLKHSQRVLLNIIVRNVLKSHRSSGQKGSWGTVSPHKHNGISLCTSWTGNLSLAREVMVKWEQCSLSVGCWIHSLVHGIRVLSEFFHYKRCAETHQGFSELSDRSFVCHRHSPFRRCPLYFL